jgi:hypothetical protein
MDAKLIYCIECEKMTHMEIGLLVGHENHIVIYDEEAIVVGVDIDFCSYPSGYAFVAPPPALSDGWESELTEPGVDELEDETDFNSLELGQLLDYFGYDIYELAEV